MLHEALISLFKNRPTLAAELLQEALDIELPVFTAARTESPELNEVTPTEYRADLVALLSQEERPLLAIVGEVQLERDREKQWVWPAYLC